MANGHFKHKTFKRSYREDYLRDLEVPGVGQHIFLTFKMIFSDLKIFLPLILIVTILAVGILGFLNFTNYRDAAVLVVVAILILITWLVTIFVLRHRIANNKIGLRDALYNAMTPLLSSLVVLIVIAIQAIPLAIVIIAYSSAVETHFLDTPFYAFLFFTFAALLILLTLYLWSGMLMAFVAVSAPGLYPYEAMKITNELMAGRKIKFILRIIALLMVLFVLWALTIWPMAMWVGESPVTSIVLTIMGCFSTIFVATYLYIYYRYMIDADKKEENEKRRSRKKNS